MSPTFSEVVEALALAAPVALASRYENLAHCVEASVAGVAVLSKYKIKAKARPCQVRLSAEGVGQALTIGIGARQAYAEMVATGPMVPYEEWIASSAVGMPKEEHPFHEIIRARSSGQEAIIDLTLGQLRQTGAPKSERIPLAIYDFGATWPQLETDGGWLIQYGDCPHPAKVIEAWNSKVNVAYTKGLAEDMAVLTDLALQARGDRNAFYAALLRNQPAEMRKVVDRLAALGKPAMS